MENSLLQNRLKELRKELNLTQEEVAKKIGLTKSAYGYYEQGKTVPDAYMLSNLAKIFDVSTDYLLGRTLVRNHIDTVAAHKANPHEDLPEEAQEQLNDYIEFLMNKYKK